MLALSSASLSFAGMVTAPSRSAPSMMAKSKALPFLEAPAHCDGTLAGDEVSTPRSGWGSLSCRGCCCGHAARLAKARAPACCTPA